jgi:L-malate glycosyltransferase
MSAKVTNAMHIIHVSTPLSWRGGEQQILYLARALKEKGVEQTIFCPEDAVLSRRAAQYGITCFVYKRWIGVDPFAARALAQLAAKSPGSILHLHDSKALTLALLSADLWGCKSPWVAHRRVSFPIGLSWMTRRKWNHDNVKALIGVSEGVCELLRELDFETDQIHLIHDGVSLERPDPQPDYLSSSLNLDNKRSIVGNIAALTDEKGPMEFVKTAEQCLRQGANAYFIWFGEGKLRKEAEDYIKKQGLQADILLPGFRDDIIDCLADMQVLYFTSQMEGLGTTLLDAMVVGVPIVCFDVPGVREVVRPGCPEGFLLNNGDRESAVKTILDLLKNEPLRQKTIAAGHERAKQFDFRLMAEKTWKVYREV